MTIFQVPLIEVGALGTAARHEAALSRLRALCTQWTAADTDRVCRWAEAAAPTLDRLKSKGAVTGNEHIYRPRYDAADAALRAPQEAAILRQCSASALWDAIDDDRLESYLLALGAALGAGPHFRTGSVGTAVDASGAAIRYPASTHIAGQLRRLAAWLRANRDAPIGCAPVAMNIVFNLHPFDDHNGRCGRILFALLCGTGRASVPLLPLHELAILSGGAFTLRLRAAQYHANWAALLDYLEASSRYVDEIVLANG